MSDENLYAPGAPEQVWRIPNDVLHGLAKLTLMRLWSKADHEVQRNPVVTTVFARDREGLTPAESLRADLAEGCGFTTRMVRSHLTELRKLGLIRASGRLVTLIPPIRALADDGKPAKETASRQVCRKTVDGKPASTAGKPAGCDGKPASTAGKPSSQLTPPIPQSPQDPQAPLPGLGSVHVNSAPSDDEQIAQFWSWYNAERADAWARWRPDARVGTIELLPDRRKKLMSLCRRHSPKGADLAEQLAVARKVVAVARREIDRDKGRVMDSGWDSMRRLADYWLRREHFDRMAAEPEPMATNSNACARRDDGAWWLRNSGDVLEDRDRL